MGLPDRPPLPQDPPEPVDCGVPGEIHRRQHAAQSLYGRGHAQPALLNPRASGHRRYRQPALDRQYPGGGRPLQNLSRAARQLHGHPEPAGARARHHRPAPGGAPALRSALPALDCLAPAGARAPGQLHPALQKPRLRLFLQCRRAVQAGVRIGSLHQPAPRPEQRRCHRQDLRQFPAVRFA